MFTDLHSTSFFLFFFNDTATTEIYTLSLHDALPISVSSLEGRVADASIPNLAITNKEQMPAAERYMVTTNEIERARSEEHTSELQSPCNLVCRLLLEKKKKITKDRYTQACRHQTKQI